MTIKNNNNNKVIVVIAMLALPFEASANLVDTQFVPMNSLFISIAFLLGLGLFANGLLGFYRSGTQPQQYPAAQQGWKCFAGILLLSCTAIYNITLKSIGMDESDNPLVVDQGSLESLSGGLSNSWLGEYLPMESISFIIGFIWLFGLYSFLKAIYTLKDMGNISASQQGGSPLKKAIISGLSGIICMNLDSFACLLGRSAGTTVMCL
ncbi:hypothetical protein AB4254_11285 [Vibrio breoganii]